MECLCFILPPCLDWMTLSFQKLSFDGQLDTTPTEKDESMPPSPVQPVEGTVVTAEGGHKKFTVTPVAEASLPKQDTTPSIQNAETVVSSTQSLPYPDANAKQGTKVQNFGNHRSTSSPNMSVEDAVTSAQMESVRQKLSQLKTQHKTVPAVVELRGEYHSQNVSGTQTPASDLAKVSTPLSVADGTSSQSIQATAPTLAQQNQPNIMQGQMQGFPVIFQNQYGQLVQAWYPPGIPLISPGQFIAPLSGQGAGMPGPASSQPTSLTSAQIQSQLMNAQMPSANKVQPQGQVPVQNLPGQIPVQSSQGIVQPQGMPAGSQTQAKLSTTSASNVQTSQTTSATVVQASTSNQFESSTLTPASTSITPSQSQHQLPLPSQPPSQGIPPPSPSSLRKFEATTSDAGPPANLPSSLVQQTPQHIPAQQTVAATVTKTQTTTTQSDINSSSVLSTAPTPMKPKEIKRPPDLANLEQALIEKLHTKGKQPGSMPASSSGHSGHDLQTPHPPLLTPTPNQPHQFLVQSMAGHMHVVTSGGLPAGFKPVPLPTSTSANHLLTDVSASSNIVQGEYEPTLAGESSEMERVQKGRFQITSMSDEVTQGYQDINEGSPTAYMNERGGCTATVPVSALGVVSRQNEPSMINALTEVSCPVQPVPLPSISTPGSVPAPISNLPSTSSLHGPSTSVVVPAHLQHLLPPSTTVKLRRGSVPAISLHAQLARVLQTPHEHVLAKVPHLSEAIGLSLETKTVIATDAPKMTPSHPDLSQPHNRQHMHRPSTTAVPAGLDDMSMRCMPSGPDSHEPVSVPSPSSVPVPATPLAMPSYATSTLSTLPESLCLAAAAPDNLGQPGCESLSDTSSGTNQVQTIVQTNASLDATQFSKIIPADVASKQRFVNRRRTEPVMLEVALKALLGSKSTKGNPEILPPHGSPLRGNSVQSTITNFVYDESKPSVCQPMCEPYETVLAPSDYNSCENEIHMDTQLQPKTSHESEAPNYRGLNVSPSSLVQAQELSLRRPSDPLPCSTPHESCVSQISELMHAAIESSPSCDDLMHATLVRVLSLHRLLQYACSNHSKIPIAFVMKSISFRCSVSFHA
jgi:hypothetical protein